MYEHIYIIIISISLIYLAFIYHLTLTLIKALTILFLILTNQVLRNIASFQHIILQDLFRRQVQRLKIDFQDLLISHCAYLKIPQSQHKISLAWQTISATPIHLLHLSNGISTRYKKQIIIHIWLKELMWVGKYQLLEI